MPNSICKDNVGNVNGNTKIQIHFLLLYFFKKSHNKIEGKSNDVLRSKKPCILMLLHYIKVESLSKNVRALAKRKDCLLVVCLKGNVSSGNVRIL